MSRHATQPVIQDDHGVERFQHNPIVQLLLDDGNYDMNRLAVMSFDQDDRQHFAQLIGYSVCGYGDLSYHDPDVLREANKDDQQTERELASVALEIQDASNPVAVANFVGRVATQLSRLGLDHPAIEAHPAMRAVTNKLCQLLSMQQSRDECFTQCAVLARPETVSEVDPA